MADVVDIGSIERPAPQKDRYGRYVILDDDGTPHSFTRATTIASGLPDKTGIHKNELKLLAWGIGQRPDLVLLAQTHHPDTDKAVYRQICDEALSAAGSSSKASIGTGLHRLTEDVDAGRRTVDDVPEEYRDHLRCYVDTLAMAGVEIHPEWIEQILVFDNYGIAGTADRIVTLADGRRMIADLKTGRDLSPAWVSISVQMAIYANHTATWDPATQKRGPRIDVDREQALIIWLPASGTQCKLYFVDLVYGYDAMLLSIERQDALKRRDIAVEYKPANGGTGGAQAWRNWLKERIENLAGDAAAVRDLTNRWPDDVAMPFPDQPTPREVDLVAEVLTQVEALHEMPWSKPRPGV